MEKILIDELVDNIWSCPFDSNTFKILISNEESINLLQKFGELCECINYEFSSPGNSFQRELINILNRKYQDRLNGPCSIRNLCESNNEWLLKYDYLIEAIRSIAIKVKHRELEGNNFNFTTENDIITNFRSDVLNREGIIATYNTFKMSN